MAFTTYRTWIGGELVDQTMLNAQVRDNGNIIKTCIDNVGNLATPAASTLTLTNNATGAVTPTLNRHALDTFGAAAAGSMRTITIAGSTVDGHLLILQAANIARIVTLNSGLGNVTLQGGDMVFDALAKLLVLQLWSTTWYELCRSNASTFIYNDPNFAGKTRF